MAAPVRRLLSLRADGMGASERTLLVAAARVVLTGGAGDLRAQVDRAHLEQKLTAVVEARMLAIDEADSPVTDQLDPVLRAGDGARQRHRRLHG